MHGNSMLRRGEASSRKERKQSRDRGPHTYPRAARMSARIKCSKWHGYSSFPAQVGNESWQ
jgi:hypothetical protein